MQYVCGSLHTANMGYRPGLIKKLRSISYCAREFTNKNISLLNNGTRGSRIKQGATYLSRPQKLASAPLGFVHRSGARNRLTC